MATETPKQLGYVVPAEWQEHSAVWLAWPYDKTTFPKRVAKVEKSFVEIIKTVYEDEPVELLVLDSKMQTKVTTALKKAGVDESKITFHITEYADVWIRDYGPIFINNPETHDQAWVKWAYNAYGKGSDPYYADLLKDNQVFFNLRGTIDKRMFEPEIVLEGGAIDFNGEGMCLTTEQTLLHPNRNPGKTKQAMEKYLADYLGAKKTIWLKEGLTNDHTDGHIDELARFVGANKIVYAYETDEKDENFTILKNNYETLKAATNLEGKPFELVKLPMPHMSYNDGSKAPVSYTNFYIGNTVVLAAVFNDPNDSKALEIIQSLFPERKVVPIDCTDIIYGGGAIHCMTQQQPAA